LQRFEDLEAALRRMLGEKDWFEYLAVTIDSGESEKRKDVIVGCFEWDM
jgi:hypothetical protein